MLIPMGIMVGVGICLLVRAIKRACWNYQCDHFDLHVCEDSQESIEPVVNSGEASFFELPSRWLAIKGESPGVVQAALGLEHVVPCSWQEGVLEALENKLFIAPPIMGWILVMGSDLPDPAQDVDRCYLFLANLSRKLGQIQFFSLNRVLNHHAWASLDKGRVSRAYCWAEDTLWDQGTMTSAERELDLRCFGYCSQLVYTQRETLASNCEKINQLAARWSIDPTAIPEANWNATNGVVGEFIKR